MPVYSGTYIPNFESFYSTAEREEIDDIALRVIYDLTVRIDTLVRHDRIVAETGSRYTSFYSLYLRELSKNHTDRNRRTSYEWMDSCSVQYSAALYVDLRRRILEECVLLPNIDNLFHTYDEPLPAIEWELDDAVCGILGYRCMKARCSFRGREWSVWYAPDLPVIAGFWKFHGLPGMVWPPKTLPESTASGLSASRSPQNRCFVTRCPPARCRASGCKRPLALSTTIRSTRSLPRRDKTIS